MRNIAGFSAGCPEAGQFWMRFGPIAIAHTDSMTVTRAG
jgi:hypothetical protein